MAIATSVVGNTARGREGGVVENDTVIVVTIPEGAI